VQIRIMYLQIQGMAGARQPGRMIAITWISYSGGNGCTIYSLSGGKPQREKERRKALAGKQSVGARDREENIARERS
jgi:hypothetical protein